MTTVTHKDGMVEVLPLYGAWTKSPVISNNVARVSLYALSLISLIGAGVSAYFGATTGDISLMGLAGESFVLSMGLFFTAQHLAHLDNDPSRNMLNSLQNVDVRERARTFMVENSVPKCMTHFSLSQMWGYALFQSETVAKYATAAYVKNQSTKSTSK